MSYFADRIQLSLSLPSKIKPAAVAVCLALLASCGTKTVNPVTGQKERTVMDERAEIAEGEKGHQQVLKEYSELKDPRLQAYVNEIGQRLARNSERSNLQ
jgi:predicted Zn-dependent protease